MSAFSFRSTVEQRRLDKLAYGANARQHPNCFGVAGELALNQTGADGPCRTCEWRNGCEEAVEPLQGRLRELKLDCFGDYAVRGRLSQARGRCFACPVTQACGDWLWAFANRDLAPEPLHARVECTIATSTPGSDVAPVAASRAQPPSPSRAVASAEAEPEAVPPAPPPEGIPAKLYAFPSCDVFHKTLSRARAELDAQLILKKLTTLSFARREDGAEYPYSSIRARFCALSIALNERRVFPPGFRATRRLKAAPKVAVRAPHESLLSNDLQVIDIHWLWCTSQLWPVKSEWKRAAKDERFDFDLASSLARESWRPVAKVEELGITPQCQRYLTVLHDKSAKEWIRHVLRGREAVGAKLEALSRARKLKLTSDRAKLAPDAYVALRLANGAVAGAMHEFPVVAGRPIKELDMRKLKKWLTDHGSLARPKRSMPSATEPKAS
jgi:hypothetical protein